MPEVSEFQFHPLINEFDLPRKMRTMFYHRSRGRRVLAHEAFEDFANQASVIMTAVDSLRTGAMTPREYLAVVLPAWNAMTVYRRSLTAQSQMLPSVPTTILAGLFIDLPARYPHLAGLTVKTEMRCLAGVEEDGSPMLKNQDVGVGFAVGAVWLPLATYEVKESYIEKTMMNSPISMALSTRALFPHSRAAIMTPAMQGGKPGRFLDMFNICGSKVRQYGARVFDTEVILQIREQLIQHLVSLPPIDVRDWQLPRYEEYLADKIMVELEGHASAADIVRERLQHLNR